MVKLKIGCDPEMFLIENGWPISAHDLFPGTKEEPYKVERGAIQVDGLALEFNIDPAETFQEFDRNISTVLKEIDSRILKINKEQKRKIIRLLTPIRYFSRGYFNKLPDNVKVLGCEPDFNSKDASVIVKKQDITKTPFRTAAGHIHVGWTEGEDSLSYPHLEDCRFIADYFWKKDGGKSPHTISLTQEERTRLEFYGGDGAFRPKPYGVELRSYSNLWVHYSDCRRLMFDYITKNVQDLYKGS